MPKYQIFAGIEEEYFDHGEHIYSCFEEAQFNARKMALDFKNSLFSDPMKYPEDTRGIIEEFNKQFDNVNIEYFVEEI